MANEEQSAARGIARGVLYGLLVWAAILLILWRW